MTEQKSILLIISGSIAAYKSLELIRRLQDHGVHVNCILTDGGAKFITPLSVASISGNPVYTDLWSLKDESEMGHIRLSRESDLVVVAPASANILAKMASGLADDLATTALLATDKPVIVAPAMNAMMWSNHAVQRNLKQLKQDGITVIEPATGELACGETGTGRLAETETLIAAILHFLHGEKPLKGLHALVTSGPTFEPIDPVRFIGNRSSGKQGIAIAAELAAQGAQVHLVTGPIAEPIPDGIDVTHVETAAQMLEECQDSLPVDIAVFTAAVADWRAKTVSTRKLKKRANTSPPDIQVIQNPDILKTIATRKKDRPKLVIGFAAETENVVKYAKEKLTAKNCDWIIANDVSEGKVFGKNNTDAHFISARKTEHLGNVSKQELAQKLVTRIATYFETSRSGKPEKRTKK
jgi:phosphopantothenoylcysteine decarboxylase/phosphopantothenate--cysteine ligase